MPTPTEQLLSQTLYAADGVTTDWDFSFSGGYILKSHVKAYVEAPSGARTELVITEDMLTGPYTLRLTPAIAAGNILTIYRDTPKDLPLVNFTDESGFSEIALDTNAKQAVFIGAETVDEVRTGSDYEAAKAAEAAATSAEAAATSAAAASLSAGEAEDSAVASTASALASANSATSSATSASNSAAAATTVFNANTTVYSRTLLGGTTDAAARTTLGAAASGVNTDITSLTALTNINGGQLAGMRNRIINGGMQVAQRGGVAITNNVDAYGGCDRTFAASYGFTTATGSVVQGGSFASGYSSSGWLQGIILTTTGSGNVRFGQKIESANTADLNGKTITIQAKLVQDTAGPLMAKIEVYKANTRDNFIGQTFISSSALVAVAGGSTVSPPITHTLTLGSTDASNGLAVYITYMGVGAVAGNSFYIGDFQLELGTVATPFEQRPYGLELMLCQRYFYFLQRSNVQVTSDGYLLLKTPCPVVMRANPTITTAFLLTLNSGAARTIPTWTANGLNGEAYASEYTANENLSIYSTSLSAEL